MQDVGGIQHTVLMAFSRPKNIPALWDKPFGMRGQGVVWVPLYHRENEWTKKVENYRTDRQVNDPKVFFRDKDAERWVKPWDSGWDDRVGVNPGNWKVDKYLDHQAELDDTDPKRKDPEHKFFRAEHYISFFTDDSYWSYQHWIKLKRHFVKRRSPNAPTESNKVVMCAGVMAGGNIIPAVYNRHRDGNYWDNNTCRTFVTGVERLTVRADLMRDIRFGDIWMADGLIVEKLVEENSEHVGYCNDSLIMFNALRPELWGFPEHA